MMTNLTMLPDPTKSVWDQPTKEIEILMYVDEMLRRERRE